MKIALFGLAVALGLLGLVEVGLRRWYGLGNPPLYVADVRTGYRLAPNQSLRRRGNRIEINQYSMRSAAIQPQPEPEVLRVLMLGDSILNGSWWTDQADTLSAIVQRELTHQLEDGFRQVEVLNASANSWGPRNELGYVLRFGTFASPVVVMVLNTDDLFAIAPNSHELGRSRSYPTRRPPLALVEALTRLRRPQPIPELQSLYDQPGDRVGVNLEAIRQLHRRCQQSQSQLLLVLTPLQRELAPDGPRDYELVARNRLYQFAQQLGLPYLDLRTQFQQQTPVDGLYRDHIHLSPVGNHLVGQQVARLILDCLTSLPHSTPLIIPPEDTLVDPW